MKFDYKWYGIISAVLSSGYFIYPHVATKILPILALSLLTYCEKNRYANLVSIGLIFSSFGDIALQLNGANFFYFMFGIVFFLIAHLFYIAAYRSSVIDYKQWIPTGVVYVALYGCLMGIMVPSIDPPLIAAVLVYGCVICSMAFLATNRYFTEQICKSSRTVGLIGALFFVASDSTLSLNKFKTPIPGADIIIMVTYYIGQTFIAMSAKDPFHADAAADQEGTPTDTSSPLLQEKPVSN